MTPRPVSSSDENRQKLVATEAAPENGSTLLHAFQMPDGYVAPTATEDAWVAHRTALEAQAEMQRAAAERDRTVERALAGGVRATVLADALGVTRERIYQMARRGRA